ncbi:MAG: hypothetical protein WCG00_05965 [Hyphomicrobiales bacterium]|nr:hypothetical protein [Hyphomicrobiales bacterium]
MRYWIMGAAAIGLLAVGTAGTVNTAHAATAAATSDGMRPAIMLAQAETKKPETTTQKVKREVKEETAEVKKKVKRAWKKLTGYKFDVACPALLPLSHSTCTETGKNRADAKARCQAQSPLCSVSDAK